MLFAIRIRSKKSVWGILTDILIFNVQETLKLDFYTKYVAVVFHDISLENRILTYV